MVNEADPERSMTRYKRVLEPMDRISEVWFGLIIVLTFTCSLSVKNAGRDDVMGMILAALGCNAAWGILDGFMYLQASFTRRARNVASLRALRHTSDRESAHQLIVHAMPPLIAGVMSDAELESIRNKLNRLPEVQARPSLTPHEWLEGLGVFLTVFLSTFPVAAPFLFITNTRLALRVSNGIALLMLFLTGYAFGRYAHYRPWRMGLWMVLIGVVLVAITVYLGG